MIEMVILAIIMAGFAAIFNRVRGTDINAPGRALFYVSPIYGLAAFVASGSFELGILVAAGYALWGTFPHGEWLDHNRLPDETDRKYDSKITAWFASVVNKLSRGNDMVAMFIRHCTIGFGITAVVVYFSLPILWILVTIPVAALMVAIHELCLRKSVYGNYYSELLNGSLIGVLITIAAHYIGG